MAIQLGSAYGKVEIDASGVKKGVGSAKVDLQSLAKVGAQVGEAMGDIGRKMTLGLTLPILAMGTAAVKMAQDLNDAKDKTRVAFGDMADQVIAWSKTTASAYGISSAAAMDAASTFGIMFENMGVVNSEAAEMSQKLVELAGDLSEFYSVSTDEALNKLTAGLAGQARGLKEWGIVIDESTVKEKAMAMGLADASGNLSDQALILARYQLLLDQTARVQGFAATQSEDFGFQLKRLKAQLRDTAAIIGTPLLGTLASLLEKFNGVLEAFSKAPPQVQGFISLLILLGAAFVAIAGPMLWLISTILSIGSSLIALWPTLVAFGAVITGTVIPALSGLAATIMGTVVPALGAMATSAWAALSAFVVAAAPVILIILAIAAAIALLAVLWKANWLGMRDHFTIVAKAIKAAWAALLAYLRGGDTKKAMADLNKVLAEAVNMMMASVQRWFGWLLPAWRGAMNFLSQGAASAVRNILAIFNIPWWQIGQNMIVGIIQGWVSGISALIATVRNTLDMVVAGINDALEMGSPSRKTFQQGKWAGEGFALGWAEALDGEGMARKLEKSVTNVSNQSRQMTNYFGNGITVREAEGMMERRINEVFEELYYNMGGK